VFNCSFFMCNMFFGRTKWLIDWLIEILLDCNQYDVLLTRIISSCIFQVLFCSFRLIATVHLSCTIMEIWCLKDNGVTTLTFWGHVTSSVTWPFDSRWATFCGWSIVTMDLSGTVMEIWPFEVFFGRLFQEGRLVVSRWSVLSITPISYTPLCCYVACKE